MGAEIGSRLHGIASHGSFEDFARDRFILGDKGSLKEEIARYRELLGVDHFIMRCQWPGLPQEHCSTTARWWPCA